MSAELKHKSTQFSEHQEEVVNKSVNVNDLIERLNAERKQERKNNILLSAAAVSAVTVFGIILTL
mgnify:FL=1